MNLIETYNGSGFYAQYADSASYDANGTPLTSYLTAVPAGTMNESSFEYSGGMITAYNCSAFKAGDEFPQSATEAIETVTANSADWNGTTETVSSNSGVWGGSALPISAGPGIKFEMVDNTLVASTDETVLWEQDGSISALSSIMNLNDDITNYDKLEFYCGIDIDAKNVCIVQANTERATISWREYFQGDGTWRTFSNFFQIGTNSITAGPAMCNISDGTNNANWRCSYIALRKIVGINLIDGGN